MATLTIADLDNGKRDLETVDAVANSQADTTTTRYGDAVPTLAGVLRRLGYQAPVPYAPGLTIDSGLATVERDGVVYRPDPALVPFTTGAWNPDQWHVIQNTAGDRNLLAFGSKADADAAAATLPDGQRVMVGDRYIYTVVSAALTAPVDLQAAANAAVAANATLSARLDSALPATKLRAVIELGQRDAYMLLQGDSTGNEIGEFYYLAAARMAQSYPSHTFFYYSWNPDTKTWETSTIQTGTGPRIVRVYNGSIPGASAIYWQGANKASAYDGWKFDLIVVNFGLNTADTDQTNSACACLYNLRYDQPEAEILMIVQPPDYTDAAMLARSQSRSDAQRRVAAAFGVATSDAFTLFTGLVRSSGNVDDWYADKIHPNAAGQKKWADFIYNSLLTSNQKQTPLNTDTNPMPNGNMTRWPNGTSSPPLWWATSSSVIRDTSLFESQGQAARCAGVGAATGTFHIPATEIISRMAHLPQIVIAARVYSSGTSNKPGTLYLAHSASTTFTDVRGNDNGYLGVGSGGFRWTFLVVPKSFYQGKTDFQIGVFSGQAGEFVTVDRILISGSLVPPDSDGTEGFSIESSYSDDAFSVAANSVVPRVVTKAFSVTGADVRIRSPQLPAAVSVSAIPGAVQTEVRFSNPTAASAGVPAQTYTLRIS